MDALATAIVEQYLLERMTYDQLFRLSEPKRVVRSATVRGPALEVKQFQDGAMYIFNAKSSPSTTGLRHKCYVRFFKPRRPKPLQNLECELDCECPDFKFRWAWVDKQRGSSKVGSNSLNQAHNRAPRITNPENRPGLCKHILAIRKYIYGQVEQFGSDEPYDSRRLDQMTARAQKRWIDYTGAIVQGDVRTQMNRNLANARRTQNNLARGFPTGTVVTPEEPDDLPDELESQLVVRIVNPSTLKLFEEVEAEIKQELSPDQEALELLRSIDASLKQMAGGDEPPALPDENSDAQDMADLEADVETTDDDEGQPPRPVRPAAGA